MAKVLKFPKIHPIATAKAESFFEEGLLAEEANDLRGALKFYDLAVFWDSCLAKAYQNAGIVHAQLKDFSRAEYCARRALEIDPENPSFHYNLGSVFLDRAFYVQAAVAYQDALDLEPRYDIAHRNLAMVYEILGERRKAIQHTQLYIRHYKGFDAEELQRAYEYLRELLGKDILRLVFRGTVAPHSGFRV